MADAVRSVERKGDRTLRPSWAPIEMPPEPSSFGSAWKARLSRRRRAERWLDTRTISAGGVKTRYAVLGDGDEACLLAAGFPETLQTWRYAAHDLARRFKVYVVEPLGMGETARPYDADYSLAGVARHLAAFLDAVKVRQANVIASDFGGTAALRLAIDAPERVRRLVVGDCEASVAGPYAWEIRGMRLPVGGEVMLYFGGRFSLFWALARGLADPFKITWTLFREYETPWRSFRACEVAIDMFRRVADDLPALEKDLGKIACPALVVWGAEDRFMPADPHAKRLAEAIDGAGVEVIEGAGHFAQEERPEAYVARIAPFLEG